MRGTIAMRRNGMRVEGNMDNSIERRIDLTGYSGKIINLKLFNQIFAQKISFGYNLVPLVKEFDVFRTNLS